MNYKLDRAMKVICMVVLIALQFLAIGATPAFAEDPSCQGEYFANPDLAGGPVLVRSDPQISFDWGGGSPAPNIPPDYFSVRWVRNVDFAQDNYRFYVNHDDGVRVFFDYDAMSPDGHLKIDGLPVDSSFGPGGNPYRVELWDAGSMVAAVGNVVGEPPFLLLPNTDNYTPWQCGNMPNP